MEPSYKDLLLTSPGTDFRQHDASRSSVECLLEYILTGQADSGFDPELSVLAEQVLQFDVSNVRAVIVGGGTGLSTVVGGNSSLPSWPNHPGDGIKREFRQLKSIVCTTDDGGSTGNLLKTLPMIAVGDLRKLLLSSILPRKLQQTYGLNVKDIYALLRVVHTVFNHRVSRGITGFHEFRDPLKIVPEELRSACPESLVNAFRELSAYLTPGGGGPAVHPEGHAVGNLFLTAAIFREAGGNISRPPRLDEIRRGIDYTASLIGAPVGTVYTATSIPGQLKFRYANGIEVLGQSKSVQYKRSSPIDRLTAVYASQPDVSPEAEAALREADVIIYAPGSLFSSILPSLQITPIVEAVRGNRRALKILCANAWIQEGETNISQKNEGRGFLVSDLIEAYERNVPGGKDGLIDVVLCANPEYVTGSTLRNYALEGKFPIYLDKAAVESLGVRPVEATLFSQEDRDRTRLIQHDPQRFALAVKALLYADRHFRNEKGYEQLRARRGMGKKYDADTVKTPAMKYVRQPFLCEHTQAVKKALRGRKFQPEALKETLIRAAWDHRDISPEHLTFFRGVRVIAAEQWARGTEWDNVLGYFDPEDRYIKLHRSLLSQPRRLEDNLLIALGESLLGRYIKDRRWFQVPGARCYEIILRPEAERECCLSGRQLCEFLRLAQMIPDEEDVRVYRITVGPDTVFFPSGLLFGLTYSWYLTGHGLAMEHEMALLRRPAKMFSPRHRLDRARKENLVKFFRNEVFGHKD